MFGPTKIISSIVRHDVKNKITPLIDNQKEIARIADEIEDSADEEIDELLHASRTLDNECTAALQYVDTIRQRGEKGANYNEILKNVGAIAELFQDATVADIIHGLSQHRRCHQLRATTLNQCEEFKRFAQSLQDVGAKLVENDDKVYRLSSIIGSVTREFDRSLPLIDGKIVVAPASNIRGNRSLVRYLFKELLTNSLKYRSPRRAVKVDIFRVAQTEGSNIFAVVDNSRGIPREHRTDIFRESTQFGAALPIPEFDETVNGVGLGLRICSEIATELGGRLWLERSDKTGSEFRISVPIAKRSMGGA